MNVQILRRRLEDKFFFIILVFILKEISLKAVVLFSKQPFY